VEKHLFYRLTVFTLEPLDLVKPLLGTVKSLGGVPVTAVKQAVCSLCNILKLVLYLLQPCGELVRIRHNSLKGIKGSCRPLDKIRSGNTLFTAVQSLIDKAYLLFQTVEIFKLLSVFKKSLFLSHLGLDRVDLGIFLFRTVKLVLLNIFLLSELLYPGGYPGHLGIEPCVLIPLCSVFCVSIEK